MYLPNHWKTALIRPVAKVKNPNTPSEYRPISVLLVISRLVERYVVHRFIFPAFSTPPMDNLLKDQFAFSYTGSTATAIISIVHNINELLETNEHVTIISLNFSKAVDTIRHSTLVIQDMIRVKSMKVLGVTITDNLHATNHVDNVITSCLQSMYALRVLRAHGLPYAGLHSAARATTIAWLLKMFYGLDLCLHLFSTCRLNYSRMFIIQVLNVSDRCSERMTEGTKG